MPYDIPGDIYFWGNFGIFDTTGMVWDDSPVAGLPTESWKNSRLSFLLSSKLKVQETISVWYQKWEKPGKSWSRDLFWDGYKSKD